MARQFSAALKELRIHLCQTSKTSEGVRNFIQNHYIKIKTSNPKLPILIRECSDIQPKVWARYEKGKEVSAPLSNLSEDEVLKQVTNVATKS
ncbi:NADH dehydrogenase [ubiquinone] 1 alpha subcomplex subunit 2-like [Agrilus planipennis]|uniref:NADH dehydrogenase [ubiquinone] 1 alpha subcomplex subunit 2 n=1 Tax=Agrilus planipennis TaxID=224129 RepID=A0A1W4WK34_AGRPL|nr:NADH dehydrogenase [ubiquinone] 1 alpha subcomplex subunit 2-like [Agrilus planipennis]